MQESCINIEMDDNSNGLIISSKATAKTTSEQQVDKPLPFLLYLSPSQWERSGAAKKEKETECKGVKRSCTNDPEPNKKLKRTHFYSEVYLNPKPLQTEDVKRGANCIMEHSLWIAMQDKLVDQERKKIKRKHKKKMQQPQPQQVQPREAGSWTHKLPKEESSEDEPLDQPKEPGSWAHKLPKEKSSQDEPEKQPKEPGSWAHKLPKEESSQDEPEDQPKEPGSWAHKLPNEKCWLHDPQEQPKNPLSWAHKLPKEDCCCQHEPEEHLAGPISWLPKESLSRAHKLPKEPGSWEYKLPKEKSWQDEPKEQLKEPGSWAHKLPNEKCWLHDPQEQPENPLSWAHKLPKEDCCCLHEPEEHPEEPISWRPKESLSRAHKLPKEPGSWAHKLPKEESWQDEPEEQLKEPGSWAHKLPNEKCWLHDPQEQPENPLSWAHKLPKEDCCCLHEPEEHPEEPISWLPKESLSRAHKLPKEPGSWAHKLPKEKCWLHDPQDQPENPLSWAHKLAKEDCCCLHEPEEPISWQPKESLSRAHKLPKEPGSWAHKLPKEKSWLHDPQEQPENPRSWAHWLAKKECCCLHEPQEQAREPDSWEHKLVAKPLKRGNDLVQQQMLKSGNDLLRVVQLQPSKQIYTLIQEPAQKQPRQEKPTWLREELPGQPQELDSWLKPPQNQPKEPNSWLKPPQEKPQGEHEPVQEQVQKPPEKLVGKPAEKPVEESDDESEQDYDNNNNSSDDNDSDNMIISEGDVGNGAGSSTTQNGCSFANESQTEYRPGGYHPVSTGDVFRHRYYPLRKLGWGHYSTVWLCFDTREDRYCAIKLLKSEEVYTNAARHEIKLLRFIATLNWHPLHERLVNLTDSFTVKGVNGSHKCLVLDVLGENMLTLIQRSQYHGIPLHNVKQIAHQVLQGLSMLHDECRIIHTDLKPENVLLTANEETVRKQGHFACHNYLMNTSQNQEEEDKRRVANGEVAPKSTQQKRRTRLPFFYSHIKWLRQRGVADLLLLAEQGLLTRKMAVDCVTNKLPHIPFNDLCILTPTDVETFRQLQFLEQVGEDAKKRVQTRSMTRAENQRRDAKHNIQVSKTVKLLFESPESFMRYVQQRVKKEDSDDTAYCRYLSRKARKGKKPRRRSSSPSTPRPEPRLHFEEYKDPALVPCKVSVTIADVGNACFIGNHVSEDIQTREYRALEVILGAGYNTSADIWSAACLIWELATGEYLFYPSKGPKNISLDEVHLALIIELCGEIPDAVIDRGEYSSDFFTKDRKLINCKNLKPRSMQQILMEKFKWSLKKAKELESFLMPMLRLDPALRCTAQEALNHPWLRLDP